jgi:SPOR domain
MQKTLLIFSLLGSAIAGYSQEENWLSFETESKDSLVENAELDFDAEDGELILHEDSRIVKLEEFVRLGEESLEGVLMNGFRVMIYFDQEKNKSEQQKAQFLSLYEEYRAYVDYMAPNYRVRVGNFRSRLEAEKLKQEILAIFPTAIVVKDKIQLPVLNNPEEENE